MNQEEKENDEMSSPTPTTDTNVKQTRPDTSELVQVTNVT